MASKVKVTMSSQGAKSILNSDGVQRDLLRRAQRIRDAAGLPGYVADVRPGQVRAHARVSAKDSAARRDNARNQTLLKSLDRGR